LKRLINNIAISIELLHSRKLPSLPQILLLKQSHPLPSGQFIHIDPISLISIFPFFLLLFEPFEKLIVIRLIIKIILIRAMLIYHFSARHPRITLIEIVLLKLFPNLCIILFLIRLFEMVTALLEIISYFLPIFTGIWRQRRTFFGLGWRAPSAFFWGRLLLLMMLDVLLQGGERLL